MKEKNFLLEIGTEELPIKKLTLLSNNLAVTAKRYLEKEDLKYKKIRCFVTPRRICISILNLNWAGTTSLIIGPKIDMCYYSCGRKKKQIEGFLKKNKVDIKQLKIKKKKNGSWLVLEKCKKEGQLKQILSTVLDNILYNMSKIDNMHYSVPVLHFIRPIRWIMCLFKNQAIIKKLFNIKSSDVTYGHRFHSLKKIKLLQSIKYESLLKDAYVVACYNKRKKMILNLIFSYCKGKNFTPIVDGKIINELTGIVEYPSIMIGLINKELVDLPREILISVIQMQQKCLPLVCNKTNQIINKFIIISNLKIKLNRKIIIGNEKVMHSRLKDAHFHYNEDLRKSLKERILSLKKVVFYKNLGSMLDKIKRLTFNINKSQNYFSIKKSDSIRVTLIAKSDLSTNLVSEFHELQGVISSYYTEYFGEKKKLSILLKNQYYPKYSDEKIPENNLILLFCIFELIDSLLCLFKIKNINSDKDPYALRRKALGLLKIFIYKKINTGMLNFFNFDVYFAFKYIKETDLTDFIVFLKNRLKIFYRKQNFPKNIINSVLENEFSISITNDINPYDIDLRIRSAYEFSKIKEFSSVINLYKRINNLLIKNNVNEIKFHKFDYYETEKEKALQNKIIQMEKYLKFVIDYKKYFYSILKFSNMLDNFLKKNIILSKDKVVLQNRINLLYRSRILLKYVIDLDKL